MRNLIIAGGLAVAMSLPLTLLPSAADAASCSNRKATGTILGGVGGALLGGAVTSGSTGPIIGGVGGALVGREIGKNGCRRTTYRTSSYRAPARAAAPAVPVRPARVYYDQYGQPVSATPVRYAPAARTGSNACRTVTRSFYDERGRLVERSVQNCR